MIGHPLLCDDGFKASYWSDVLDLNYLAQGLRPTMEDEHIAVADVNALFNLTV